MTKCKPQVRSLEVTVAGRRAQAGQSLESRHRPLILGGLIPFFECLPSFPKLIINSLFCSPSSNRTCPLPHNQTGSALLNIPLLSVIYCTVFIKLHLYYTSNINTIHTCVYYQQSTITIYLFLHQTINFLKARTMSHILSAILDTED